MFKTPTIVLAVLLFLFTGLSSVFAQTAPAQPIYIKCETVGSLVINSAAGTVTLGGNSIPATITPSAIDFQVKANSSGVAGLTSDKTYHIDRATGALSYSIIFYLPGGTSDGPHISSYQCAPDLAPPQTKF